MERNWSRRDVLKLAAMAVLPPPPGSAMAQSINQRPIPRTGELVPIVGLGTWQTFDVGTDESARAPLREVMRQFLRAGGRVVDSSPMYGRAEAVTGRIATELNAHGRLFLATKVWTSGRDAGIRQMEESLQRLGVQRLDLMQIHNLLDWRVHLPTLRRWKEQGRIRYLGVTHYAASAYPELARVLETEPLDFVQLNYSVAEREAERRLLPLAQERRIAVLINRPFAQAALFRRVRGRPLPEWAGEIGCKSWAQLFLKFVLSHPAVTCAIPATSKVDHLLENMQSGTGVLPDSATRERIAAAVASS